VALNLLVLEVDDALGVFFLDYSKPQAQLGYLTLSPLPIIDAHQPCVLYSIAVGGGKQNLSIHREQGHDQAQAFGDNWLPGFSAGPQ